MVNNVWDCNEIFAEMMFSPMGSVEFVDGLFKGMIGKMVEQNVENRVIVEIETIKR